MIYCVGPTELVQRFVDMGSSHRRKSAAKQIIDIDLAISLASQWKRGAFYLFTLFLPAFAAPGGERGESAPCVMISVPTKQQSTVVTVLYSVMNSSVCIQTNSANIGPFLKISNPYLLSCTGK